MEAASTAVVPRAGRSVQGHGHQYLIFTLHGEAFAVDILHIREIIEYGQLTEVPMMPAAVRGVINLRGSVVPVVDLSVRFGRARVTVARRSCVVILEVEEAGETQLMGVLVDAVSEVMEISPADIELPPPFGAGVRSDFIAGMGRASGGFVIILDLSRLLALDPAERSALAAGTPEVPPLPE